MSDITYYSVALLMAVVPAWTLISGRAGGIWWWRSSITRQDEPLAYWCIVAVQVGVLVLFLLTGRSWHLRS